MVQSLMVGLIKHFQTLYTRIKERNEEEEKAEKEFKKIKGE